MTLAGGVPQNQYCANGKQRKEGYFLLTESRRASLDWELLRMRKGKGQAREETTGQGQEAVQAQSLSVVLAGWPGGQVCKEAAGGGAGKVGREGP